MKNKIIFGILIVMTLGTLSCKKNNDIQPVSNNTSNVTPNDSVDNRYHGTSDTYVRDLILNSNGEWVEQLNLMQHINDTREIITHPTGDSIHIGEILMFKYGNNIIVPHQTFRQDTINSVSILRGSGRIIGDSLYLYYIGNGNDQLTDYYDSTVFKGKKN